MSTAQHSPNSALIVRNMSDADLPCIARIQRECYRDDLLESVESFAAKLSVSPDCCFVAVQQQQVVGYAVAMPWRFGEVPELGSDAYRIPPQSDSLYIHDIAVSTTTRKLGAARHLLNSVMDAAHARRFAQICLVAVQGASSYWSRYGFASVPASVTAQRKLSMYGDGATLMARLPEPR